MGIRTSLGELVGRQVVSTPVLTVDFPDVFTDEFSRYRVLAYGILTDIADDIVIRLGTGSTYTESASSYHSGHLRPESTITQSGGSENFGRLFHADLSTETSGAGITTLDFLLFEPANAAKLTSWTLTANTANTSGSNGSTGQGARQAAADETSIRFLLAANNDFTAGTFEIYGIR